jgi:hypothetical protein
MTAKLVVTEDADGGVITDAACKQARTSALRWVSDAVGAKVPDYYWSLENAGHAAIPPIAGGSFFGAFAVAFLRAFVLNDLTPPNNRKPIERPDRIRRSTLAMIGIVKAVCLDTVAISANGSSNGGFIAAGGLEQKMASLAADVRNPACILAWDEDRPLGWTVEQWNGGHWDAVAGRARTVEPYERWTNASNKPLIIVRANDALDAIARLFELQRNGVKAAILPI